MGPGAAGVRHGAVWRRHPMAEADRRLVRTRSRKTAAVAAARAAATAMRVICQPGMPPAVITRTAGAAAGPYGPSPGTGMIEAEAAGTAAAQASRTPVTAARAAVIRRSRAAVGGWVSRR